MTTGIAYGPLGETRFVRHGKARVIRGGKWRRR